MSKQAKPRNVATLLNRAKLRNVATLLNRAKLEYLSSVVFHTVLRTHSFATRTVWKTIKFSIEHVERRALLTFSNFSQKTSVNFF